MTNDEKKGFRLWATEQEKYCGLGRDHSLPMGMGLMDLHRFSGYQLVTGSRKMVGGQENGNALKAQEARLKAEGRLVGFIGFIGFVGFVEFVEFIELLELLELLGLIEFVGSAK